MTPRMPDGPERTETERAGLRAKRIVLAVVILVSLVFTASSSWQIIPAVFGLGVAPLPPAAPGTPERDCAVGVRSLLAALDRAGGQLAQTASTDGDLDGIAALRARLSPEWDGAESVRLACEKAPEGQQAWAALERMRVAEEQIVRLGRVGVAPLRVEVAAHLPPDLR